MKYDALMLEMRADSLENKCLSISQQMQARTAGISKNFLSNVESRKHTLSAIALGAFLLTDN